MAAISWDMTSYDTVRSAILARAAQGLGYDFDGWYGYQCWDLGANWYYNAGRQIMKTKNSFTGAGGEDSGVCTCWTYALAFEWNSANPFVAIPSTQIKRGDMVIWNKGRYSWDTNGHNGFADQDYVEGMTTIRTLGQNQVDPSATVGHIPTLTDMSTNLILGAFRYRPWFGGTPPQPDVPYPDTPVQKWRSDKNFPPLARAFQKRRGMIR